MTKFFYIAKDKEGKKITDVEDAGSSEEVAARLQGRGLFVINIYSEHGNAEPISDYKKKYGHSKISAGDLVNFCRQMATLLGSGVTILRGLDIILKQVQSRRLYEVIIEVKKTWRKV